MVRMGLGISHGLALLAVLALNRVARGKAVSIVSWGGHARDFVTKQFLHLEGLVDYVGHVMHPGLLTAR